MDAGVTQVEAGTPCAEPGPTSTDTMIQSPAARAPFQRAARMRNGDAFVPLICAALMSAGACSLDRTPQGGSGSASDPLAALCGSVSACPAGQARNRSCDCVGEVEANLDWANATDGGGGDGDGDGDGDGGDGDQVDGSGGNIDSGDGDPSDGAGGTVDTGGGGAGAVDTGPDGPTSNPFGIVTAGRTRGTCQPGLLCSMAPGFGNICTEGDGTVRICTGKADCARYGPNAICQFSPTFQSYCNQSCVP